MIGLLTTAVLLAAAPSAAATSQDPVVRAMRDELERAKTLKLADSPSPYYASYHVFDVQGVAVSSSFGALVENEAVRARILSPTVRVGDKKFDATGFPMRMEMLIAPWEDEYDAIRHQLWLLTDDVYKTGVERYRQQLAERKQTTRDAKDPDSYTDATTQVSVEPAATVTFDRDAYVKITKAASAVFREHADIQGSGVSIGAFQARRRFLATDGAMVDDARVVATVQVSAFTQAADGTPLSRGESFVALDPSKLPTQAEVVAAAKRIAKSMETARTAPVVDNYDGPVLFEGEAAAQLMAFVLPGELSAQPFMGDDGRLGRRVLPKGVTVIDDPTIDTFAGQALFGRYTVDYEGVAAKKVTLVDKGKQVGMLMGRTPNREVAESNGHARGAWPGMTMITPGNLIVTAKGGKSDKALRKKLVGLLKKEGLDFGYVVTDLGLSPWSPPGIVRIDAKGKTEPVRVDQMQLPEFKELRRLVGVGNAPKAYNYLASGSHPGAPAVRSAQEASMVVPASVVSPSLLFDRVQLRKATGDKPKPPLYPHPHFAKK